MSIEEDPAQNTRARWLGVVLILVALGALIWQAWLSGPADEAPFVEPPLQVVNNPSLSEMLDSVDAAKLGSQAASAASRLEKLPPLAADETEICTVGRVKADASGEPINMEPITLASRQARERLVPNLLNSSDEMTRAAGLLLQSVEADRSGAAPLSPHLQARDTLAQMAVSSSSPRIYGWALRACQGQRGEGMCQMLSAEQWARLDPGNAVPWLQVGIDAQARRDVPAVAEAMYRVSLANSVDMGRGALAGVVLSHVSSDAPVLAKGALADLVATIENTQALPHLVASQHCGATEVRDANRRQICAAVADVFQANAKTLADLDFSAFVGQHAGWTAERLQLVQDERDAIQELLAQRAQAPRWTCPAIGRAMRELKEVSEQGELAVMRRALKESPNDVATLARRHRDTAEAKRAAARASAPLSVADR